MQLVFRDVDMPACSSCSFFFSFLAFARLVVGFCLFVMHSNFMALCSTPFLFLKDAKTTPIDSWSVPMHFGGSSIEPSSNLA